MKKPHPSNSTFQRKVESLLLRQFSSAQKILKLAPQKVTVGAGQYCNLDGVSEKSKVICEAYAHIGSLKSAQKDKVAADILKLLLAERVLQKSLGGKFEKYLLFCDPKVEQYFKRDNWLSAAVTKFGIKTWCGTMPKETSSKLIRTQKLQIEGMKI